ncbi:hypothetical protein PXH69_24335 [Rhodococcus qingshengii]|uniref:Uncharacterized protein n=1 Tax=Rhodococcus qingshengii TaxID=334542 RepID=A0AAW6LNF4_RHOSG|nr:hypothetical protein [Rhodococcus qingshengii]MDE8648099.1 hypothetical protein [Rhodococcus qingshengii]
MTVEAEGNEHFPEDRGSRVQYKYVINSGEWEYVGNDIHSPVGAEPDEQDAARGLFAFLDACAEARSRGNESSENWNIFPDHVAEWAMQHSSEIALHGLELDDLGFVDGGL